VLVNNIEFDHADIYPDLPAMVKQYHLLEKIVHPEGSLLIDYQSAKYLNQAVKTFGLNQKDADYQGVYHNEHLTIFDQSIACWGRHNAHNLLGLYALFDAIGISLSKESLQLLSMPLRRCQFMMEQDGVKWYDDFAHHPTAICAVYRMLVERYKKVALIIHPATYTQRSKQGFSQLVALLSDAPHVAILPDARQDVLYDLPSHWQYVTDQSQAALWAREQPVSAVCVMSSQFLDKVFEPQSAKVGN
jgi:UDP-N-acetylmuramate: L-alanyl-gamma-D-glutamyl-meso-diaminopimelate ligase